jgi:hypothetical protein
MPAFPSWPAAEHSARPDCFSAGYQAACLLLCCAHWHCPGFREIENSKPGEHLPQQHSGDLVHLPLSGTEAYQVKLDFFNYFINLNY